jgi:hypothetical protein
MIISVNNINLFAFVIDMKPIFFEVGTEFSRIISLNIVLEDLVIENRLEEVQVK